jgi:hypothetical protein
MGVVSPGLDVVDRKVHGCEPSDVDSGISARIWILFSVEGCGEQSWFVRIWVELDGGNEWVGRQLSFKQA